MIRRLVHVDRVGVEERAATLGRRSVKGAAKAQGVQLAVSMVDLTTLEGSDTPGKVRQLSAKANPSRPTAARGAVVRGRVRLSAAGRGRRGGAG